MKSFVQPPLSGELAAVRLTGRGLPLSVLAAPATLKHLSQGKRQVDLPGSRPGKALALPLGELAAVRPSERAPPSPSSPRSDTSPRGRGKLICREADQAKPWLSLWESWRPSG